ncbi:nuclease-related domain-containing DEAD/DEAH box helicase [Isoptericola sp. b408]|uniref:nuclease-related domain-containing DEAD/DEAH box helicase n=1 Tax=Isoptericola sp. b408 TaxID=3064653 RepID=UPI002712889E|nr:NERD domain-containing protein [Isoptericola sp. b408]MDO8150177.1 NERD domain-containing protein [Isoptericola sp. b408]
MPRTYPPTPDFPDDGGAERAVWEALREQLPDEAVVCHGVHLQEGDQEYEIDLLVAWPGVGVAAIEVKGGHIERADGAWYQGSGPARHRIDPVAQVQGSRHALQALLQERGELASRARTAHLVAFPHRYVSGGWDSLDLPRDMLIGRDDLERSGGVAEHVKHAVERHGQGYEPLDHAAVDGLVDLIAGGFPSQSEHLTRAVEHETRLEQMTRDQVRILDALSQVRRMRVLGGAGSGKTYLALEQARRRTRAGERVALLCYSRGLGRYFQRITAMWPRRERPAYVGLFHDLPVSWGAAGGRDDDPDYWERHLPLELGRLAGERAPEELFDAVVVDEAQDFGDLWWPSLLRCLRDAECGGVYAFLDDAQRVFPRDGRVPLELTPVTLDENLRSTKQIAQVFGSLSPAVVKPRGLDGPPVRLVDVPADEALDAADDAVEALLDEGWDPGDVVLLATGRRHPEQVNEVELGGHAAYWDAFFAQQDVFYGHVLGFKGLERPVVVLAVNGIRDVERARKMLYTGLSRARTLLVVVGDRSWIEEIGGEAVRKRLEKAEAWLPAV